ncbi:MAG TPA: DNA polymerase III subunit gamma/tau C-terminal domain-containing protein, partial [Roseateles sp.]|nr:DNA polymerase III subunit gamma/tau C-terminal domain-containing protein [Roseateles sp.]
LRPRPVAVEPAPEEGDEPPPWLDAPPVDEDGMAAAMPADDAADGDGAAEPSGGYASTAGRDVPLVPTALGERWAALVKRLPLVAMARELALQAECIAIDEQSEPQRWCLKVERESLRQQALQDKLQAALGALLERAVQIEVEAGPAQDSPALRDAAEAQARQRQTEKIVFDDPLVQQLMAQFKTARIVPGSIKPH